MEMFDLYFDGGVLQPCIYLFAFQVIVTVRACYQCDVYWTLLILIFDSTQAVWALLSFITTFCVKE